MLKYIGFANSVVIVIRKKNHNKEQKPRKTRIINVKQGEKSPIYICNKEKFDIFASLFGGKTKWKADNSANINN